MAYQFRDDNGNIKNGGEPSPQERAVGERRDNDQLGELCSFEELYGDD